MTGTTAPAATARTASRLRVGLAATLRQFVREPVTLGLILALPPVVVASYGSMMSAFPRLPSMTTDPGTLGVINGTLFVGAFLPGVIGLFQVISADRADERLSLAGFPRSVLFGSRLLTVLLASLLTAGVSLTVLALHADVTAPLPAFGALALAGTLYGLLGTLVGAVLPRELEGSLVLVFVADVDEALASGLLAVDADLARLFPLHYPHRVFQAAVEGTGVATGDLLAAGGYGLALFVAALLVYARVTGEGGVLP